MQVHFELISPRTDRTDLNLSAAHTVDDGDSAFTYTVYTSSSSGMTCGENSEDDRGPSLNIADITSWGTFTAGTEGEKLYIKVKKQKIIKVIQL